MKHIIHYAAGILFLLLTVTSCTITQEYHFNRDLSGTASTTIDMTALMEFMNSMDTTESSNSLDTLDENFAETAEQLRELGAENVEFGWKNDEKNIIYLSYKFDDVKTLNEILASQDAATGLAGGDSEGPKAKFINKGRRKLTYKAPNLSDSELKDNEEIKSMAEYYEFKTIFTFDRKIKKLEAEGYEISDNKKKISNKANLNEMLEDDYTQDFNVKLSWF